MNFPSRPPRGTPTLSSRIQLGARRISAADPAFIIAEAGVNHNGDMKLARELIAAAKEAGADAVKFQTFRAETLVTPDVAMAKYQEANTGKVESQFAMLKRLELPREEHAPLMEECRRQGILFLSTPFDFDSADFLGSIGVPAFKVGSSDTNNIPLLVRIARKGKPILFSTGMSGWEEVKESIEAIAPLNKDIIVFQCTTNYPCAIEEAHVGVIDTIRDEWRGLSGFSDHTQGDQAVLTAVALGVNAIEKHFTLSRKLPGPDQVASIEPHELKEMIAKIRDLEKLPLAERRRLLEQEPWFRVCYGSKVKQVQESVRRSEVWKIAQKSVIVAVDIPAGTRITEEMLTIKRPGTGLKPKFYPALIGKTALRDLKAESLISLEDVK